MKGKLINSNGEWMVKYTTYKTMPGIKGVMGSHSRIPESNNIPLHPDDTLYLCPGDNGQTIDFGIIPVCTNCGRDHCDDLSCRGEKDINYAKLINEEKNKKPSKQKKYTNIMSENNIKKMYTEEDLRKAFKYGVDMEAGLVSFDYKNYPDGFSQFIGELKQKLTNYNKEIEDAVDRVNKGIYISNDDVMNEIQNIIDDDGDDEN